MAPTKSKPKSILKSSKSAKPIPGTRTASGKRVRPGQNLRKAAAAEKESESSKAQGKGKGRFDKKLAAGGKYEKYLGPGEYTGPTGGNAGPLGKPGGAVKDVKGKGGAKDNGKGKKKVTISVRKEKNEDEEEDVDMSGDDGFGDEEEGSGSGSEGEDGGTDEELGTGKSKGKSGNSTSSLHSTFSYLLHLDRLIFHHAISQLWVRLYHTLDSTLAFHSTRVMFATPPNPVIRASQNS
jgi:hypothetical protein